MVKILVFLFQQVLPFLGLRRLQLRHLVEVFMLQRGPYPLQQLRPADLPLHIPQVLAEVIGKGPVVFPADQGVGRGLVVGAAAEERQILRESVRRRALRG